MSTTTLPQLRVELDGAPLDPRTARALASVTVLQRLSLPALCELTFVEPAGELRDAQVFKPGTSLRVTLGELELLFAGDLTGVLHRYGAARERVVRLRASDALHRLRTRQPVRAHVEKNLGELASELVSDLGLSVVIDDAGPVWTRTMQWWQSDLELLTELADRCGQHFVLCDQELRFVTFEGEDESLPLELGRELIEARIDASHAGSSRSVEVRAWDPWESASHEGRGDAARTGRTSDLDPLPSALESDAKRLLVDEIVQSDAQAAVMAQAQLDWSRAGEVVLAGVATGDVRLRPGRRVAISGVAMPLEGDYVLTSVTHRIDREGGYRCELDSTPPPRVPRIRGAVATVGEVIDVGDPSKLGRIKLRLPSYADLETDWLEVALPGAGAKKGLTAVPDVGDRVLLLLPRHDPAQGVVLGGLYGSEGPKDPGVEGAHVKRYTFSLPGGQRLVLDAKDKEVHLENGSGNELHLSPGRARIENSVGSFVELSKDKLVVHAATDLEIEAPGKALVFVSSSVDFRTG